MIIITPALPEFIRKSVNHRINQLYIIHFELILWGVAPNPTFCFALM